jgi:hypothetical protein
MSVTDSSEVQDFHVAIGVLGVERDTLSVALTVDSVVVFPDVRIPLPAPGLIEFERAVPRTSLEDLSVDVDDVRGGLHLEDDKPIKQRRLAVAVKVDAEEHGRLVDIACLKQRRTVISASASTEVRPPRTPAVAGGNRQHKNDEDASIHWLLRGLSARLANLGACTMECKRREVDDLMRPEL